MLEIRAHGGFMAVPLLLLCCVCAVRTSLSSVVFQSPENITQSVNGTFSLKCTRDLPIDYCYSSISWFKLEPRTGKMSSARTDNEQHTDDKKSCIRTINNAQVQDSGIYYCVSIHDKMAFIGTGTRVIITDSGPLKPSVLLYTPVEELDAPSVLLQCLVMDAVPSQISVWWMVDGEKRSGWIESGWTRNDDSAKEYARAQIRVPTEDWRNIDIECVVAYGNQSVSKILQPKGPSHSTCTWLLVGGCGMAVITIAVVLAVALCLRKEKSAATFQLQSQRSGVDPRRRHQDQGKQKTLTSNTENPSSQVEYSCLNHEIFKRQADPASIEIQHQ